MSGSQLRFGIKITKKEYQESIKKIILIQKKVKKSVNRI
jgi:hypothetical protein